MDHSMDLTKTDEEYKLGIKRHNTKKQTPNMKQEEVSVTCHLYLASRTSLFLGTSSGLLLIMKPKNEFHAEIVRTDLHGHRGSIFDILFLGDEASSGGGWGHSAGAASLGHLVATCSADRTIKLWDLFERDLKQRCIQTLIGHEGSVTSMTFLRGSLITCSTDNSVKIWRSSPERSLLLYPFFEVVQEIWGPGGASVPTSLASVLGQPPPPTGHGANGPNSPSGGGIGGDKGSVLKSCPFVVGRLVRAEQQLLFVGDVQGRVYTFVPPARGGFTGTVAPKLRGGAHHPNDGSGGVSDISGMSTALTTQRTMQHPSRPGSSMHQHPSSRPGSSAMHHPSNPSGIFTLVGGTGAPSSSTFDFSRSHKIHALSVSRMLIVNQESLIITLSFDHTVQVHDCLSSNGYFGIENPTRCRYLSMDWDLVNQELFLSDELGYIQVWNVYIERCLKSIKLKNEPIYSLSLHHPNKLLLGVADGIEIWTIQRNVKFNEFKGHEGPIVQLLQINSSSLSHINLGQLGWKPSSLVSPSGGGGQAGGSLARKTTSGRTIPTEEEIRSITHMVSEEKYLYSASLDFTIRQWDSYDMNALSILKERQSEISCMAYLPGSIILATGHDEGVIRLWNIDSGTYMNLLHHRNTISCLCVAKTPRQDILISGSFDGTIAVWDVSRSRSFNPNPEWSMKVSEEEVLCCVYHTPLGLIFTGGNDCLIHMWSSDSRAKTGVFKGHKNAVGCLALDGNFLISGSDDTNIIVWNIHFQYPVCTLSGHELSIRDLVIIPTYGFIISCAFDGRVIIWNYTTTTTPTQGQVEGTTFDTSTNGGGCAIKQFHHLQKRFRCLLYDAQQRKIFAGTEEARIMFFILPEELFPDYAERKKAGEKLRNEERRKELEERGLFGTEPPAVTTSTTLGGVVEETKEGSSTDLLSSPAAPPTVEEEEEEEEAATLPRNPFSPTTAPPSKQVSPTMGNRPLLATAAHVKDATNVQTASTATDAAPAGTAVPTSLANASATASTASLASAASSMAAVAIDAAEVQVDYSVVVAELLERSKQIQVLLSTVKPLPARSQQHFSSSSSNVSSSATLGVQGSAGQAASALKRGVAGPTQSAPSMARRASLTNSTANLAALAAAGALKGTPEKDGGKDSSGGPPTKTLLRELSPPTQGQAAALRRQTLRMSLTKEMNLAGTPLAAGVGQAQQKEKDKDLTLRPQQQQQQHLAVPSSGENGKPIHPPTTTSTPTTTAATSSAGVVASSGVNPSLVSNELPQQLRARSPSPSPSPNSTLPARGPVPAAISSSAVPSASVTLSPASQARRGSMTSGNLRDIQSLLRAAPANAPGEVVTSSVSSTQQASSIASVPEGRRLSHTPSESSLRSPSPVSTESSVASPSHTYSSAAPSTVASPSLHSQSQVSSPVAVARRASMLTSANLRELSVLLKPQPAPAASDLSSEDLGAGVADGVGATEQGSSSTVPALNIPTALLAADSSTPSATNGAAGDADAPLPDLKPTARTNRFSMPSGKGGRLQFEI